MDMWREVTGKCVVCSQSQVCVCGGGGGEALETVRKIRARAIKLLLCPSTETELG
jgi:hypothetical protein